MYVNHFSISNWIFNKIMIYIISIPSFINAPLLVIEIIGVGFFIPRRHASGTKYPGSDRVKIEDLYTVQLYKLYCKLRNNLLPSYFHTFTP